MQYLYKDLYWLLLVLDALWVHHVHILVVSWLCSRHLQALPCGYTIYYTTQHAYTHYTWSSIWQRHGPMVSIDSDVISGWSVRNCLRHSRYSDTLSLTSVTRIAQHYTCHYPNLIYSTCQLYLMGTLTIEFYFDIIHHILWHQHSR